MAEARRDALGGAFIAIASLQFGGTVILGKIATASGLPVPSMLAVRFGIAAVGLAALLVATRQPIRAARGEGARLVTLGAAGYAVESGLFFLALGRGTAAAVTLLFFTYPIWVAVLSAVLGMGVPGWLVGGALVAAVAGAGLVVASSGGLDISVAGIGFALAAAAAFSIYLLGADALVRRTSSLAAAAWVSGSASIALAAVAIATGSRPPSGWSEWLPVVGMGLLTSGAFACLFLGLRRVGAVRTSIIAAFEPVATAILAFTFLGEAVRAGVVGGGALILAAAVVASLARGGVEPEAGVP